MRKTIQVKIISCFESSLFTDAVFNYLKKSLVMGLLCCFAVFNAQAGAKIEGEDKIKPLRLGLIPHLSTNMMMKKYQNLLVYLEEKLDRPVIVNTAPNFKSYVDRCARGDFDLYMTAPHMAIYHEKYNQHIRLAKFSNELRAVITVRDASSYRKVSDLQGKTVSAPDALAVNTINGEMVFKENGMNLTKDVNIKHTTSNNNPLVLLSNGKVDAAITGLPGYKMVSKSGRLKEPLRMLKKSKPIPHMMFLSPSSVSQEMRNKYRDALLTMMQSEAGKAFFSGVPFGKLVGVTTDDAQRLEGMMPMLEKRLK